MAGRKLIVIVDGDAQGQHVAEWQRQALATLAEDDMLTLLVCINTSRTSRPARYPAYYALNLLSVRNEMTRSVPLTGIKADIVRRVAFECEYDGAWQKLPAEIIELVAASGACAIIKLGMGLMRIPPELQLPVLSWHHGDPEHYRGRPAGFWELLHGREVIGQMVQVLTNRLDAGQVVAFAQTRVYRHSWKQTLVDSFRHSPLLLEPALARAIAGETLDKPTGGKNYRLPGNRAVLRVGLALLLRKAARIAYGAFWEKNWRVSHAQLKADADRIAIAAGHNPLPGEQGWTTPAVPRGCAFVADPFFDADGRTLLVEALSSTSGVGEIHRIAGTSAARLSDEGGHFSYPGVVSHEGRAYCVPEIAQWSEPAAYSLEPGWKRERPLDIAGNPHITDPTFLEHGGGLYLFGNRREEGSNVLRLWHARNLFDRFEEHPCSPIRISPRGGRMGGDIVRDGSRLVRLGQDFTRDYGDGLIAFEVDKLGPDSYREREIGTLRFSDRRGPHTVNFSSDGSRIVFDWYKDRFSPMAGVRRAIARLRQRQVRQRQGKPVSQ